MLSLLALLSLNIILLSIGVILCWSNEHLLISLLSFYFTVLTILYLGRKTKLPLLMSALLFLYVGLLVFAKLYYGGFTVGVIGALYESNYQESIEFISSLGAVNLIFFFFFVLVFAVYTASFVVIRKKHYVVMLLIFLVSNVYVAHFAKNINSDLKYTFSEYGLEGNDLMIIRLLDTNPFSQPLSSLYVFYNILNYHNSNNGEGWNRINYANASNNNEIYVVVIGESALKSHFSIYGYKLPTMKDVSGLTVYDGVIAPSVVTRLSVPRMLSKNESSAIYQPGKNIIALANQAGLETYWLSNQAKYGIFDTQVSKLASEANHVIYTSLDYLSSRPDSVLLPIFERIVSKPSEKNRVVFINTMGSHSDFCSRFDSITKPIETNRPKQLDCYDNSIKASFDFLLELRFILDQSNLAYQMIYFSDHGLRSIDAPPYYIHDTSGRISNSSVEIPFFLFDSKKRKDMTKIIQRPYNMRDFSATFADWTNIEVDGLNMDNSIFRDENNYLMSYEVIDANLRIQTVN